VNLKIQFLAVQRTHQGKVLLGKKGIEETTIMTEKAILR
jgi:hypothetical protein